MLKLSALMKVSYLYFLCKLCVFYYGMFCDCLTGRQIILSLKIKKLLYVKQTFEDTIYVYQFVACKNHVLFAFSSDNQRKFIDNTPRKDRTDGDNKI